jgi:Domain of unknown function (DUF4105)
MMLKKILLPIILFCFCVTNAQTTLTEKSKVSLLTVGTANASHSFYGHTALRIFDASLGIDLVYNYGMFDFRTENFMLKFVKGDLQYFAAAYPYEDFEYNYQEENRSIFEQVLNLSLQEKQALFEKLNKSLLSDDKFYTYKFIDRNCTTKVIDVLNDVLEKKPIVKKNIDSKSYRDVLYPYIEQQFFQKLGINIIFGTKVDNQATKLFLPFDLLDNLNVTNYEGKPLVIEHKTLFTAKERIIDFSFIDSIYMLIAILLLIIIINKKAVNIIYFSIIGLIGLLFSFIGLYSFHKEILWNYNIILFNPLLLFLVFFMIKNNQKWIKRISITCLIFIGVYVLYMLNKIHLLIVLPIVVTNAILLLKLGLKKKL